MRTNNALDLEVENYGLTGLNNFSVFFFFNTYLFSRDRE